MSDSPPLRVLKYSLATCAIAAPIVLAAAVLIFRFIGEHWWVASAALYLPRVGFLLPLPLLSVALWIVKLRKLIWLQLLAAVIAVFPLMGLQAICRGSAGDADPSNRLRLLSFNADSGEYGYDRVFASIRAANPDVVLLQEVYDDNAAIVVALKESYRFVEKTEQFVIATHFPIVSHFNPPRIAYYGSDRHARFMRYELDTGFGRISVFNVHPISPREALQTVRGRTGFRRELTSGRLFEGVAAPQVQINSWLRALQVAAFSANAAEDHHPVIIAGDTNMPTLSRIFGENLGDYRDGFADAGCGFGYTFPAKRPWMRIDRILTSDDLAFSAFSVDCRGASDHLCVIADITKNKTAAP